MYTNASAIRSEVVYGCDCGESIGDIVNKDICYDKLFIFYF